MSNKSILSLVCGAGNRPKPARPYRRYLAAIAALIFVAVPAGSALALTTISQGYVTSDQVAQGSIVSLKKNSSDEVNAAATTNVDSILGVVINTNDSLLSLTSGQSSQVQVATSGVVQTLVSDINGSISQGDEITASPVAGVGMKATSDIKVVGIAQSSLDSTNSSTETYKDKSGSQHTIAVGDIPVLVNVSYFYKLPDKTIIPSAVQNIADALAGKQVNTVPILLSIGVFMVTVIVVVSIVYSMIHSSIISVGRNPMSQAAVYRDVIQLSALVVGILAVAVVLIYMILTKL